MPVDKRAQAGQQRHTGAQPGAVREQVGGDVGQVMGLVEHEQRIARIDQRAVAVQGGQDQRVVGHLQRGAGGQATCLEERTAFEEFALPAVAGLRAGLHAAPVGGVRRRIQAVEVAVPLSGAQQASDLLEPLHAVGLIARTFLRPRGGSTRARKRFEPLAVQQIALGVAVQCAFEAAFAQVAAPPLEEVEAQLGNDRCQTRQVLVEQLLLQRHRRGRDDDGFF